MPLLETLVVTVGGSIAKGLLNIWLKDDAIPIAMGEDLIDLIRPKTLDLIGAKKGKRFFDEIGDKVATSLKPVFESYNQLDTFAQQQLSRTVVATEQVSFEAVAKEVSAAIDAANISTRLLAACSNDPTKLLERIKQSYPSGGRGFSEAEESLYNRALNVSAQYIIDIASNLPDYTASNFTEVLQKIDLSMRKIDQVLEDLDQLREVSESNVRRKHAEFERDYRASILRKLDRVHLFGADLRRSTKRYRLSVAYVSLDVTEDVDESSDFWGEDEEEEPEVQRFPVETALARCGQTITSKEAGGDKTKTIYRYVIIGEAGSGKTTLLQWLAVKSASNSFDRQMSGWVDKIPFFIELRRYPEHLPVPEEFIAKVTPEIAGQMPNAWVHDALRNGRALLLIDGLDEIPSGRRDRVYDWIASILDTYYDVPIVVTTRPASYDNELEDLDFVALTLMPMELLDVRLFIDYWHRAVLIEPELESKEQVEVMIERLVGEIRNSTALSRLATNPLLCAMICALYYDRNMQLPAERIALYESCCTMLLERRDVEREIQLEQHPKLSYKQKRILLDDLAYWMMKNGYSSITPKQAIDRMALRFPNMQLASPNINASDVLHMLVERSGMIRQPTSDTLDFVHRTFQEYMAASSAVSESDLGLLIRNATDDQWKETIILFSGLCSRNMAELLLTNLLELQAEKPKNRAYLEILAVSCLATAVEVSSEIRQRVEQRLHTILPPNSRERMNSLVTAGDLAVAYLGPDKQYSEEGAGSCIQVLARIGTLQALKQLENYSSDTRRKVATAFDSALRYFTPEYISRSGIASVLFQGFDKYFQGDSMRLSGNIIWALSQEPLSRWQEHIPPAVRHLNLIDCDASCMFVLGAFKRLEALTITGKTFPEDFYPLVNLEHLTLLDLRNKSEKWPHIKRSPLAQVRTLRLMTSSSDFPDFIEADFPNLTSLHLYSEWIEELLEMESLTRFSKLEHLSIATWGGLPSLSPLKELDKLKTLELSMPAEDFPDVIIGLDDLDHLTKLIINVDEISPTITHLVNDTRMGLSHCKVVLKKNWSKHKWTSMVLPRAE